MMRKANPSPRQKRRSEKQPTHKPVGAHKERTSRKNESYSATMFGLVKALKEQTTTDDLKKRKRSTTAVTPTLVKCLKRRTPTKVRLSRVRIEGQDGVATDIESDEELCEMNDTTRTPSFSADYVEELNCSLNDMANKYKISCEYLEEKDKEIEEEKVKRTILERRLSQVRSEMNTEHDETIQLEMEVVYLRRELEECKKRADEDTLLRRPYVGEIGKLQEEKMNSVSLRERYEESTKEVEELKNELRDAKFVLDRSEEQAEMIVSEKEEKISDLQLANDKLRTELEEARRLTKCLEEESKNPIPGNCRGSMANSISVTESVAKLHNQISNNEHEYPEPLQQINDQLSRLRPPPKQNHSDHLTPLLLEQAMDHVPRVKSFLASQLQSTNTSDLNTMIDLANNAFSTLDCFRTDYGSFHGDIRDFIRCRGELMSAEEEHARILYLHKQVLSRLSDAGEAMSNAELELRSAMGKSEDVEKEIVEVRETMRRLEKDKADREVKIRGLKDERERCGDAYRSAENEAENADRRRREIDRRVEAAVEGDKITRCRLNSHLC